MYVWWCLLLILVVYLLSTRVSRMSSGAQIKIAGNEGDESDRLVTITGTPEAVGVAQYLISSRCVYSHFHVVFRMPSNPSHLPSPFLSSFTPPPPSPLSFSSASFSSYLPLLPCLLNNHPSLLLPLLN